jgi:serine/threonine protein kinase
VNFTHVKTDVIVLKCCLQTCGTKDFKPCKRCYLTTVFLFFQAIFMIPTKPPPFFKYPDKWSEEFKDFVKNCLVKNPEQRITAQSLLMVRN